MLLWTRYRTFRFNKNRKFLGHLSDYGLHYFVTVKCFYDWLAFINHKLFSTFIKTKCHSRIFSHIFLFRVPKESFSFWALLRVFVLAPLCNNIIIIDFNWLLIFVKLYTIRGNIVFLLPTFWSEQYLHIRANLWNGKVIHCCLLEFIWR